MIMLALGAGCTLQLSERAECSSNVECRAAFGPTSVCGDEGFCNPPAYPKRCSPYPEQLDTDPDFSEAILYGMMVDRALEGDRRAQRAGTLAVDLANDNGGLNEEGGARSFGLVVCDYQSDLDGSSGHADGLSRREAAVQTAEFLIDRLDVTAILGPTRSTETEAVYVEVARPGGTLLLTPGARASVLAQLASADAGLLWRTVPPEDSILEAMVASIGQRGVTSVFVLAQQGVGGGSATMLQNRLAEQTTPPSVAAVRLFAPEGEDLVSAINEAAESSAQEIVFLADHPSDSVRFLEIAAGDERFADKTFIFDATADDPAILAADAAGAFGPQPSEDGVEEATYRVRIVRSPSPTGTTTSNFRNQYRAAYGNEDPLPHPLSPASWDGMWMLMLAAAAPVSEQTVLGGVGTLGLGLRALSDTGVSTETSLDPSNWRVAQEVLREGATLDVEGASGDLDYDLVSSELSGIAEVDVIELVSGQWQFMAEPPPMR